MKFGWVVSTYCSHENGQTSVPMDAAFKYGAAFAVSPLWILHGTSGDSIDEMLIGQPDEMVEKVRDLVAAVLRFHEAKQPTKVVRQYHLGRPVLRLTAGGAK